MKNPIYIVVYLDTDTNGNDLPDNVGNPIPAGWYRYEWPMTEPSSGPFNTQQEAETYLESYLDT